MLFLNTCFIRRDPRLAHARAFPVLAFLVLLSSWSLVGNPAHATPPSPVTAIGGKPVDKAGCKFARWGGTTSGTYFRDSRIRNSIGTGWFPDGIDIDFAYEYRLLMGEPLRKFVPKVAIPKQIVFDTNKSGFADIQLIYDTKLGPQEISLKEYEPQGGIYRRSVFRVGARIMQGMTISQAQMRMSPRDAWSAHYMEWHSFQGIFGVPGKSGWDVEGAPGWANAYSAPGSKTGEKAERDNKQVWCRVQGLNEPLISIELTDMAVSIEGVIANMRKLSPEFNELLRIRAKKPLVSALAAGMQKAGGSERAKALMKRALKQLGGRLDEEERKVAEHALDQADLSTSRQGLVHVANDIAREIPSGFETKPEFDKSLVRRVHAYAQQLDGGNGYRDELHRIAERVHRLTLIGRLPPLDVILLVDNSGSMGKVFSALKREVHALMQDIETISPSAELGMIAYNSRGYERFARRPADAKGRDQFAGYLGGLGTSAGDADFGDLLREFLGKSPFRPDGRARIILVFGDISTSGESAVSYARQLRERYPGTAVVPIWTGNDAIPQSLHDVAAASGNRVILFDAGHGKIRDVILAGLGLDEYNAAGAAQ